MWLLNHARIEVLLFCQWAALSQSLLAPFPSNGLAKSEFLAPPRAFFFLARTVSQIRRGRILAEASKDDNQDLFQWLESQQQGYCDGVEISSNDGLRGLSTTQDAQDGDVLLSVPLRACLQNDFDSMSKVGLPKKVQLAQMVLEAWRGEDNEAEKWNPFLKSWPEDIPGLHLCEPKELQNEAQCKTLINDMKNYQEFVEESYQKVLELYPSTNIEKPDFERALRLVGSRCISLSVSQSVLVPILDMANHDPFPSAGYRLHNNDEIQLVATRPLLAGEEVTICYGEHCNRELAGCYGFVPKDNPYDYELVSLVEILQAAKDAGALICDNVFALEESVSALGLPTTNLKLYADGPEEDLWLAVRAALGEGELIAEILEAIEMDEADEDDLWEDETEDQLQERIGVVFAACRVLEQTIGGRETTLEEDGHILKKEKNLSVGYRLLVELRLERKRLFRSAMQSIDRLR